jgi:hypothetical protein
VKGEHGEHCVPGEHGEHTCESWAWWAWWAGEHWVSGEHGEHSVKGEHGEHGEQVNIVFLVSIASTHVKGEHGEHLSRRSIMKRVNIVSTASMVMSILRHVIMVILVIMVSSRVCWRWWEGEHREYVAQDELKRFASMVSMVSSIKIMSMVGKDVWWALSLLWA